MRGKKFFYEKLSKKKKKDCEKNMKNITIFSNFEKKINT